MLIRKLQILKPKLMLQRFHTHFTRRFAVAVFSLVLILSSTPTLAFAETAPAVSDTETQEDASSQSSKSAEALFVLPELSEAQAAIVVDSKGNVLYSLNPEAEFNMASITKIMTAVLALESDISLDSVITCQGSVLDENAQVAGYTAGQASTFYDLLKVMLVYSANDAAYEVACAVSGSEEAFVALMNQRAQELGMTHTHFANSHGLDAEDHYSCVSDLAILARYAMTKFPFIAETVSMEYVTVQLNGSEATFESTDEFLRNYQGALGIKTGLGNNTSCFLGSARRGGLTLYSCVLGCSTKDGRFTDTYTLMDSAFNDAKKTNFGSKSKSLTSKPFAYHFGLMCNINPDADIFGYVYPSQSLTSTTSRTDNDVFLEPNTIYDVSQWTQGSRIVATAVYTTSSNLTVTRSGFGLVGELSGLDVDYTYNSQSS